MLFTSSILVAVLAGIAQAQTPSGFSPASNTKLDVLFNTTAVNTPGQQLTKQGESTARLKEDQVLIQPSNRKPATDRSL